MQIKVIFVVVVFVFELLGLSQFLTHPLTLPPASPPLPTPPHTLQKLTKASFRVILSVKICEVSLCFLTIIFLGSIFLTAHWLHFIDHM